MTDLRQGVAPITHEVLDEIERAIAKFPTWPTDPLHALAVLGEEFGELTKAVLQSVYEPHKSTPADVRAEAIQTAAMALRFLHSLDRYAYQPGAQHVQGFEDNPSDGPCLACGGRGWFADDMMGSGFSDCKACGAEGVRP
ncbi:MAG: hypothetical protein U0975_16205 [Erythrobacter sp.]|nr:hypothetical protein [Erythrobacter sp.]MDZ4274204.1 hypothetical protein [Erythrobacter sp.]